MSNRKATFAKRQRETELKDKAKAKEAQRAERRANPRTTKGPETDFSAAPVVGAHTFDMPLPPPTPPASNDSAD